MARREHRITVKARFANRLSPTLLKTVDQIDETEKRILQEFGHEAVRTFKVWAPGRLGEAVRLYDVGEGRKEIRVYARNKGYDYVGVTRFGHRTKVIKPTRRTRRGAQSVISTRRPKRQAGKGKGAALRIQSRFGGVYYRHSIPGYDPEYDWAERAQDEINLRIKNRMDKAAREFGFDD